MHVHVPKPLHGWREFIGEVGIIVIGVLIALGAEQLIENRHWHDKADETTRSVREELRADYAQAVEATTVAPCVDQQLVALENAVAKPGFTAAPSYSDSLFNRFVVRVPSRPWADTSWKAATSEGIVSHLPSDLRQGLQSLYEQIAIMELNARQVDVIAWRLRALTVPTTAEQRARSIEAIEEMRGHVDYMALVANQIMGQADAIGMTPNQKDRGAVMRQSGTAKFCRTHQLPMGKPEPTPPS